MNRTIAWKKNWINPKIGYWLRLIHFSHTSYTKVLELENSNWIYETQKTIEKTND